MSAVLASASARRSRVRTGGPVVAMVGAGQLARMTHQAAIALGVTVRVLATSAHDPAVRAGAAHLIGSPRSLPELRRLAAGADVVTFDHEHVPPEALAILEREGVRLAPGASAKRLAQDKLHARRTLAALGLPVPAFTHARTRGEVEAFAAAHGWPLVAKLPLGGYDGRGVFLLPAADAADAVLARHPAGVLLEPRLPIVRELAVLVARSTAGERVAYPVAETVQADAMCREILAPAPISQALAEQARDLALTVAETVDATGVLTVELFQTSSGLIVNELALRPHNSGHYTIEGCAASQFEQHLRAVLGWPLGRPDLRAPAVVTVNVIGPSDSSDPHARLAAALAVPDAHIHLYGKEPRPGRKLGHVTVCAGEAQQARHAARLAARRLEGSAA